MILDLKYEIDDILQKDFGLLSAENSERLKTLQERKGKYWAHEITSLRLKSRVLWINEGDANTKKFHSFASVRRNTSAIWSLNDSFGNVVSEDVPLKQLGK